MADTDFLILNRITLLALAPLELFQVVPSPETVLVALQFLLGTIQIGEIPSLNV